MKVRIKFSKNGPVKFIGHLDVMRYFQKAIRRAEVDIAYSKGFSPHQIMSFAAPLGVGQTSESEYFDIELPSNSPNYYTLECNLVRQMAYITGESVLFENLINIFEIQYNEKSSYVS